jgi:hypothetical protein
LKSFSEIAGAVRELLKPETLAAYRERAAGIRNFAVYEIPDLLDKILSDSADARDVGNYRGAPKHSSFELFH